MDIRPPGGGNDSRHTTDSLTVTTICGMDMHIRRGEYPVCSGLVIGHEMVGVMRKEYDGYLTVY